MIKSVEVPGLTAILMPVGRYGLIACYSGSATTADIFYSGVSCSLSVNCLSRFHSFDTVDLGESGWKHRS